MQRDVKTPFVAGAVVGATSIAKKFVTSISEKVSQCRTAKKLYKKSINGYSGGKSD